MNTKLRGALRAEIRAMRKELARITNVCVNKVQVRMSVDGELYAEVNGEAVYIDMYNL